MKKNTLFTLVAALAFAVPAFTTESEIVVSEEDSKEEVVINQDCGCGKPKEKDKKPPQQ